MRGWAAVAVLAVVAAVVMGRCAQLRSDEVRALETVVAGKDAALASARLNLDIASRNLAAVDVAARATVDTAIRRAATAESEASEARARARELSRRLVAAVADTARPLLDTLVRSYETAIDSLESVARQQRIVIAAKDDQLHARDAVIDAYSGALASADSAIAARDDLIATLKRPSGLFSLFGVSVDVAPIAGVYYGTRGLDVGAGVGFAVRVGR